MEGINTTTTTNVISFYEKKAFWYIILGIVSILILRRIYKGLKVRKGRFAPVSESELNPSINYSAIALRLKNVMTGVLISDRVGAFDSLKSLSDNEFMKVYNEFSKLLGNSRETLRGWVESEWMPFTRSDDELLARLDRLNLA